MTRGVLVVAKAPVPGEVKTRLAADVGHDAAAEVAAAALLDTLDAAEQAFDRSHRVVALTGDLRRAVHSQELSARLDTWQVVRQRGRSLGLRLASAHRDAAALVGPGVVQIGMDTPQVSAASLRRIGPYLGTGGSRAVLGPAEDGGWWVLGVSRPEPADALGRVAMSCATTCRDTRRMLETAGATVVLAESMRDVDTTTDADVVAEAAPDTRFAEIWRTLKPERSSSVELFSEVLRGGAGIAHGLPGGPGTLPVERWSGDSDVGDLVMVERCAGPTLDVGCGPGRLTEAVARRGNAVLGIDIAPPAVRRTRERGADALCRDVFEPVPAEGRWESVLLADGNIGIGGDPARLLRRTAALLAPHGRVLVEVAAPGTALARYSLRIEVDGRLSRPFPWAIVGPEDLAVLAHKASLQFLRLLTEGARWFVELGKAARGESVP
jgi:glycosyltransferase A (GT-A) superfamily protein (DUF2064 family)